MRLIRLSQKSRCDLWENFSESILGKDIWKHQELPIIESHDLNFLDALNLTMVIMEKQ